uniref:phage protein NinX family protein n=1 Tax=Enterobacter sp. TaxID=42895 RepID=UPI00296FDAF4|nr:phage protein NinX family protein [Enterobacter sp.]
MDYSKLSDFEINCLVAEATGHKPFNPELGYQGLQEPGDITAAIVRGPRYFGGFDPCKHPAEAWPIIVENKINIEWHEWKNGVFRPYALSNETMKSCYDTNPLRAAMIVFLMMQEKPDA